MKEHTFTIAQGAQVSNVIRIGGRAIVAAEAPDCTGTLTFNAGRDGAALKALKDENGTAIPFPDNCRVSYSRAVQGADFLQVASSAQEAAARTIYVYTEDYGG